MATPLNKAVHRVVELNGEEFIASLEPSLEFTLRKKRHKAVIRQKMQSLVEGQPEPEPEFVPDTLTVAPKGVRRTTHTRVMATDPAWTAGEIKSKLAVSEMDYKLKVEVLKAVDDLLEIDELIDESRTVNL